MHKPIKSVAAIAALMLLPLLVLAQDLYVAEGPVSDEGSETRNAKLAELLAEVMVRVSGNAGIAAQPASGEIQESAPSLVQQYRYRTVGEGEQLQRLLWARFDAAAVDRMMRERGLPVWVQRPRVLLWLAAERSGRRELLNLENEPAAREAALQVAARRGMPLQLPLMDLEDQSALQAADIWSDYEAGIRGASSRYPADVVLAGRLSARRDGKWLGGWTLFDGDGRQSFQTPAMALDESLRFAIEQTQNLLAARYAPLPGGGAADGTLVRFGGIRDLADYGRLVAILSTLEPVAGQALRHADDDAVVFDLRLRGNVGDLVRALDANGGLIAEAPPGNVIVGAQGEAAAATGGAYRLEVKLAYRLLQ